MGVVNLPSIPTQLETTHSYFGENNNVFLEVQVENTLHLTLHLTENNISHLSEQINETHVNWGNFFFFFSNVEVEFLPDNYLKLIIEYTLPVEYGPKTLTQYQNDERSREIVLDETSFNHFTYPIE